MRFTEVARRLTGFSTPIFGVSWNPGQAEVATARAVLVFLEDRRVLFAPWNVEIPEHCIESVIEIRAVLTDRLVELGEHDKDVAPHLRAMRAACRKFMTTVSELEDQGGIPGPWQPGTPSWMFNDALGQFRAAMGIQIGQLSAKYGIDLEDEVATILPACDDGNDDAGDSPDGRGRFRRRR